MLTGSLVAMALLNLGRALGMRGQIGGLMSTFASHRFQAVSSREVKFAGWAAQHVRICPVSVPRVSLDVPLQGVTAETLGDGSWPLTCTDENHRDTIQRVAQDLHTSGRGFETLRAHQCLCRSTA